MMNDKIQRLTITLMALLVAATTWATGAYTITVNAASNGNVTADPTSANQGATIKLTANPDNGYYLERLTIVPYADGGLAGAPRRTPTFDGSISATENSDGTYSFTMPAFDVEVTPTFAACTSLTGATVTLAETSRVFDWLAHTPSITSVKVGSTTLTEGVDYTVTGIDSYTNAGTYPITVAGKGKYSGSASVNYTITALSIAGTTGAKVELSPTSFVYNKGVQTPSITGVYFKGQTLIENTDYGSVTYSNSSSTNVGTYSVSVTGQGNFSGIASSTYTITGKPISSNDVTVTLDHTGFTYNGSVQKATVSSVTDGTTTLTENTDYTVEWSNSDSRDIGAYTVTVKGKGNYIGTVTLTYTITASNTGVAIDAIDDQTYTGAEIKPTITVKKDGNTLSSAYYVVVYNNNVNVGTATITVLGQQSYSFMVTQTFKIVPKDISTNGTINLSGSSFTYNGTTQKPTVTSVTDVISTGTSSTQTVTLVENRDYLLTNAGGVNKGTYNVTVNGIGNYKGSKTTTFTISELALSNSTTNITLSSSNYVYDGTAKIPDVQQVKVGDVVVPATDYTVGYSDNTNAGTATVTISPKTSEPINLSGSASKTFTISAKPVSDLTITLSATTFTYNGNVRKPTVTVKDGSTTLTSGTHYDLTWSDENSKAVGSYTVTVTGKGNYTGSINKTYVINYGTSDTDFHIALTTPSETFTYDGTAKEPAVTVTKGTGEGAVTLTKNTDYNLEYSNNINAGTATITARGIGNYQFITTFNFTINKKEITSGMVTLSGINYDATNNHFVYNGALQKPTVTIMDGTTKKLVEGTDYTLVNAGGTNVASYNATITGIGNYYTAGTSGLSMPYSIVQLSLASASVVLDPLQSYVYDGTEKRPGVQQVKVGNVIVPTTDYTVTYPKDADPTTDDLLNVNAGTNTAVVYINPATGNLSGSKTQTFSITKKPLTSEMITLSSTAANWANNSFTYTGSNQKPTVTVTDGSPSIIAESDYNITNAGGTAVGVYYATVAATDAGNYSGTIKLPYSIVSDNADSDVTITLGASDPLVYTGNPITRTITVTKGTNTTPLTINTDYEVVYTNNTNVGEATITVMGKGNYHFVKYAYFNITPRPMTTDNGITITLSASSFVYNGSTQKPNVTVTYTKPSMSSIVTLVEGTDYTLYNPGATNVGDDYKATITGVGNFSGTMDSPTYKITAKTLEGAVITLYPLSDPIYDGRAKEPAVQKVTVGGQVYTSGYTVSYSNNINVETATVKPTVTVSSDGTSTFSGSTSTTFVIQPKPLTDDMVTLAYTSIAYDGSPKEPEETVMDEALPSTFTSKKLTKGTDYTVSYTSDHTAPGVKAVTITGQGNYTGYVSKKYTIVGASDVTITLPAGTYTYNGAEHQPVVTVKKDDNTLTLNTDYTVAYSDNINAGTATITVTGKGNYDFTQTQTFSIGKRSLSGTTDITATLTPSSFTYNGNPQQPATIIVHDALAAINRDLTFSKDYTVTYPADMITQGAKTVTITGEGNYTGTLLPTYNINQLDISTASITLFSLPSYVYDGSNKEPGVQLVKVGNFVVPAEAYDVSYTNHKDASTTTSKARVTVTAKDGSNFTGSAYTEFTILQKEVNSNMMTLGGDGFNTTTNSFTYDGAAHAPTVAVSDKVGGVEIITTNDYTLTNAGGTNVGNYQAKIDGKGNYTGSAVKQYSIVTKGSAGFTVGAIAALDYTGMTLTPKPTVTATVNGVETTLTEDTHYTLAWANNVNAGTNTASVTVTGIGDYSGTQTVYFTINPKALTMAMVMLSSPSFTFNGNEQKPTVTVKDGGTTLSVDKDYTVTWPADMASQGTKTITITGIGNYSGTLEPTYTVGLKSVAGAEVTLSYESIVFNGSVQKPTVTSVVVDGHKLTAGTDYTTEFTATADYTNQGGKSFKIKGTGNYAGEKELSYTIEQKAVTSSMIVLANENLVYTGLDQHPTVTIQDMVGTINIITTNDYTLLNPDHATVGTYVVTLTGKGNYKGTAEKQYSIIGNQAAGFTVAAIAAQEYTGAEIKPEPSVTDNNNRALTKGTDYTVGWSNNINAGTAVVTVTGINGYSGTKSVNFNIVPKSMNHEDISVTLSPTSLNYTGTTQKPSVTVKDGTSKTLVLNTDYTLVNDGGVAQGTYTVTVTGIGNYKDVRTSGTSYSIGGQSLTGASVVLYSLSDYTYDGNEKKPGVSEVKLGSTVIPADNYTVSYSNNVNVGEATVTVTGKGNCSGTASTTFTITPKTVNSDMIAISETTFNYDGTLHKPATVTVKNGTLPMTLDTDYTLTNEGGIGIGTYSVTITGKGNYTGTASKSYAIVANDASGFTVDAIDDQTYTGEALTPVPVVKEGDTQLAANYYDVAYLNNINAGTAVVTVTGKNGYTFVKSQTFKIKPKPLAADMLTLSTNSFVYNGSVQKPTPVMTDKNAAGQSLITSNDYVVTNEGGADVGTRHVVITGQNNYTGTIDKTFAITQLSLSTATITLATLSSYVYDGTAKTPAVQLVKVGELVVPATAYDVAYSSNVNVGTATVTVTAKASSNFKDGNTTTFNIERKDVTSDMIYLSSENLEYTGGLQMPEVTVKDGTKTLALTTDYTVATPGGTKVGTYEVTITGQGNYKGTAKKQYSIVAQGSAGFTVDELTGTFVYTGSAQTPAVTVKQAGTTTELTLGTDYTVAYTNNVNVGTATVTVTGKGNYAGTKSVTFQITPKPLADGMVTLSATSFMYSGSEQRPSVSVKDTDLGIQLTRDAQYTVVYPTDMISQGVKTITVKGLGNYTGEITKTYVIGVLTLDDAAVTLNELASYVYDGMPKRPTVREVTVGALSVPPSGYSVSYPDDITNQGVKTITVTGQGNYTGSTTKSYTITPKTVTSSMILLNAENLICTGENIKPEVTVKDGGTTLKEGVDYTLTNDGGTPVGTYYVYITGKGNYTGNASRAYNIIAQGSSVFTVSTISSTTYNGQEQRPAVTVVDNSTTPAMTLVENTHYTISYSNNRNVGTATVTVTGIGAYSGNVTRTFAITQRQLTDDMVALSETSFTYNAIAQRPEVTVTDVVDGVAIITDNDYTVVNNGSINVSPSIEVKVIGRGNYAGTVTKTYAINPLSIEGAAVTLYQRQSDEYNGQEQKPGIREIIVGTGSNSVVVPTTGYRVDSYVNNINVGTATVTLSGQGNFTGTTQTTFNITRRPITAGMIALSSETFTYNGSVQKPTVTVSDMVGETNIIRTADYTVTNDGGTEVGDYTVSVSATTTSNYSGSAQRTYSIVTRGAAKFNIALAQSSYVYDGTAKEPAVTITDGSTTLSNENFTVGYSENVNVGTATVTVTGKGNYAGTKTVTFQITPRPLTAEMVTLSVTEFTYNGLLQRPEVTVSDGARMKASDYVVTNGGGTHVGTFHVIVDGQGNYTGQVDKTFTIAQLSLIGATVTLNELQSYAYDGTPKRPIVREVIAAGINVPSTGYTVTYGENTKVGSATVTVTGQNDFKDSCVVTFQVVQKTITADMVTLSNDVYYYNGSVQHPEVTVRDGATTLAVTTDYTLVNDGGRETGTYQVKVTGNGNYTGEVVKTFTIKTKEAGVFEVVLSTELVVYDGSEQQPDVVVRDGDQILTAGEHYTVAYLNNINVGTAMVTVRGQGPYEGSQSTSFLITPKELTDDMVVLSDEHFTYNGLLQHPLVTVSDGDAMTVNDYSVNNDGGVNEGMYTVTVTGRNNYVGTVTKTYTIGSASLNGAQVVLYQLQSYVYDGTPKAPGVREVLVGNMVVPTNCYSVTMTPNVNVGTVTVTVTGQGNYTGEASTTFNIVARELTVDMVTLDQTIFTANGHTQKPEVTVSDGDIMTEADYTVINEGGTEPGTYEVVVTGQNNYTGTVTQTYVIVPSDINIDVKPEGDDPDTEDVTLTLGNDGEGDGGFNVTGINVPEADQSKPLGITIPATVTVDGNTYRVTGIAKDAFANVKNLTDLWLPETDEPLNIEEGAVPANTNVHTPLDMLDDYALMSSLADNFVAGKVMTSVKPQNRYWTFSCGVDVCVPEGVKVFIVHERGNTTVTIVQLTDAELNVGGQGLIKSNNGVLMAGQGQTPYNLVASARRMISGTPVRTYDSKDYGPENLLEPVIEPTHYDAGEYYVLKDNQFRNIRQESEAARVPACRAVLHLPATPQYAPPTALDIVVGDDSTVDSDLDEWYDLGGRRLDARPTEKGVYIHNNKKIVIK